MKLGGHFVPDEDVIRRFYRSMDNFWNIYKNMANNWAIYYNAVSGNNSSIAVGNYENYVVENEILFDNFFKN